jgi:hypothetical protein
VTRAVDTNQKCNSTWQVTGIHSAVAMCDVELTVNPLGTKFCINAIIKLGVARLMRADRPDPQRSHTHGVVYPFQHLAASSSSRSGCEGWLT